MAAHPILLSYFQVETLHTAEFKRRKTCSSEGCHLRPWVAHPSGVVDLGVLIDYVLFQGNILTSKEKQNGAVFLFPSCPLVAKAQQIAEAVWVLLVILKRVSNPSALCVCASEEEQNVGSHYILLPTGICSYRSSTRLYQLSQYLYINKRQSIGKKRKVRVIRLKLLFMSFQ